MRRAFGLNEKNIFYPYLKYSGDLIYSHLRMDVRPTLSSGTDGTRYWLTWSRPFPYSGMKNRGAYFWNGASITAGGMIFWLCRARNGLASRRSANRRVKLTAGIDGLTRRRGFCPRIAYRPLCRGTRSEGERDGLPAWMRQYSGSFTFQVTEYPRVVSPVSTDRLLHGVQKENGMCFGGVIIRRGCGVLSWN